MNYRGGLILTHTKFADLEGPTLKEDKRAGTCTTRQYHWLSLHSDVKSNPWPVHPTKPTDRSSASPGRRHPECTTLDHSQLRLASAKGANQPGSLAHCMEPLDLLGE